MKQRDTDGELFARPSIEERRFDISIQKKILETKGGLDPSLNRMPDLVKTIHLMGICGTGMASLAGMLKHQGYRVTGSDQNIYPPMSEQLKKLEIPVFKGYSPGNLSHNPDLVVVGNVITRDNPEAMELSRIKLPYLSFPQALGELAFKGKQSIVISGTHGKTTTATLVAWILETAGTDPGFMIGGISRNFETNFKLGQGPYFVIEGDEYDTAFFDKGPKFLHYRPWVAILTSIEFDHGDIYRDIDQVIASFRKLIAIIPPEGLLIANGDDPRVVAEIERAQCQVETYGFSRDCLWKVLAANNQQGLTDVKILRQGEEYITFQTPLYGRHNMSNLLAAVVLSEFLDLSSPSLKKALKEFKSVKRRQEIVGEERGILVLDDFAHHPTAVRKTIQAVKEKHGDRRLIAVFEPRSNSSRRNIFQRDYALSFNHADIAMIPEPPLMEKIPPRERFSSQLLVRDLQKGGVEAFYFPDTDQLLEGIIETARQGDVILIMSNGGFDNIHKRLLNRLKT
ncbi:MAG: UDP-N-acetylmuramate:L-alanyl-gamma-D-glutamyl-meso-diaminopimelate ligase [Thermodesulfobacteriota bacterium]|nr:UDP-N-acetylmuramate:L-alanyl-gamma-D-glutamyl-meso-diaminopimelate ligase [Thermodesulfobacteriota bacterium]